MTNDLICNNKDKKKKNTRQFMNKYNHRRQVLGLGQAHMERVCMFICKVCVRIIVEGLMVTSR